MQAQRVAHSMGVGLNHLVSEFLRGVAKSHVELPARRMNKKLERILGQVQRDFKTGRNITGPFHNAKEAIKYLNSL